MIRIEILVSRLLARLGVLPGHLAERVMGAFLVGYGLVYLASPAMFEIESYAALSASADEWFYGLLFLAVGAAQLAAAGAEASAAARMRPRLVAAAAAGLCLAGLALAFARTAAWSGSYTYAAGALVEVVAALRLRFLVYARTKGLHVETRLTLTARRDAP